MHISKILSFAIVPLVAFGLSGCSSAKDTLGLTRSTPDEFRVVKSAPLEMPPSYQLRVPAPGAARPQEREMVAEARSVVLGTQGARSTQVSGGEAALLKAAGAGYADSNIRRVVDAESVSDEDVKQPVMDKILKIGSNETPSRVVDAKKEAARLQNNKAAGKPATAGETPSVTR